MKYCILAFSVATVAAATTILSEDAVGGNPAYVCSFCILALGLVEESAFQLHLLPYLESKCTSDACKTALEHLVLGIESKAVPEEICRGVGLCTDECVAFPEWPVNPLPPKPVEWPIERRLLVDGSEVDYSELRSIFADLVKLDTRRKQKYTFWEVISLGLARVAGKSMPDFMTGGVRGEGDDPTEPLPDCGSNVACHIYNFVEWQVPLQDSDGDWFSTKESRRFRGYDWRGADCHDELKDVYPGRKSTSYDADVDHNCNGIYGGNETGSFEDIFCAGYKQKGVIIIGDSATAHFHIPPQWLTADGWNMDQLLQDAENELDQPACSWGTGHNELEECPYQNTVPGVEGVISIYSQLRDRNRCNNNDFQNIGVNGADIQSSYDQVRAMARDHDLDQPALLWLAMIGNDVCNIHPGYDHMTTPDEFYASAVKTLTLLDEVLPVGSHVISLALFDGELLYSTMHSEQHPVGSSYDAIYDFMNCEEENPCWGWLNSDREVRMNTTRISNSLNDVYQNISDTMTFTNFEFIFYNPRWADMFSDYQKAGYPLKNLIEPADGFHPSQAGNALFAQQFFAWMESEHPEVLGDVNPHNAEIDAMFFNGR